MSLAALLTGVGAALVLGTLVGQVLRITVRSERGRQTVANANARIAAWWVLCGLTGLALWLGGGAVFALFAAFSSLALREFLRITPAGTRLLVPLIALTVLHYGALWMAWPPALATVIPLGSFLFLAIANALTGATRGYLQRTAESYWGLMAVTWCLSFAPAILTLTIPGYQESNAALLFYFLLVIQSGDILQYLWGKLAGRRPIAPTISPHKTWEGTLGGLLSATALGSLLSSATPFSPGAAAGICFLITLAGFAGGLVFSAIKRDRGLKDYGTLIPGHGGMLDRIDSLCFSAPAFYYCVRHFYTT